MIPAPEHEPEHLGSLVAHVCGALDDEDGRALEEHLSICAPCSFELVELHGLRELLDLVPPDLALAGGPPPPASESLVRRTVRVARGGPPRRPSRAAASRLAAAGAVTVLALGGGVVIGQSIAPHARPAGTVRSTAEAGTSTDTSPDADTGTGTDRDTGTGTDVGTDTDTRTSSVRGASGTDAKTGTRMVVRVTMARGWVRLRASVAGIPAGVTCRLVVVGREGTRETAASWLVSPSGERDGSEIDGGAAVAPEDVRAVEVRRLDGRTLVSVPVTA
ncbi:hypothetical protein [Streptomyces sp. NPDC048639]|uniref:hypothetical protein n=1 Tax=Streptomyces sp. NPDC048639 TaxID=3365581 RepID=UPI0037163DCB